MAFIFLAMATTAKKRKGEGVLMFQYCLFHLFCLSVVTWSSIVPEGTPPETIELLSIKVPIEAFLSLAEDTQSIVLESLVDENTSSHIMAAKSNVVCSPSCIELLHSCQLAPSTKLSDEEVCLLLSHIFGLSPKSDFQQILEFFDKKRGEWEKKTEVDYNGIEFVTQFYLSSTTVIKGYRTKEASGYGFLSVYGVGVCNFFHSLYSNKKFQIEPQFKMLSGKQYATDQCLKLITLNDKRRDQILIIWEYKPRVAQLKDIAELWHLSETILQSVYTTQQEHHILQCLTDLTNFHFFEVSHSTKSTLTLHSYYYLNSNLCEPPEVAEHFNFLFQKVKIQ